MKGTLGSNHVLIRYLDPRGSWDLVVLFEDCTLSCHALGLDLLEGAVAAITHGDGSELGRVAHIPQLLGPLRACTPPPDHSLHLRWL